MLAYCTGFDLSEGYLVYARDAEERSRLHHVDEGRVRIKVRAVNVELQPDEVLAEVAELAAELGATTPTQLAA